MYFTNIRKGINDFFFLLFQGEITYRHKHTVTEGELCNRLAAHSYIHGLYTLLGIQLWVTNWNGNSVALWKWVGWGSVDIFIFIWASLAKTLVLLRPSTTSNRLSQHCRCWLEFDGKTQETDGNDYHGNTCKPGSEFWILHWKSWW